MKSKKDLFVYSFYGKRGVLINTNNEKVKTIKPLEEANNIGFYTLEQIKNHNIVQGDCKLTYDDAYARGYYSDANNPEAIVCRQIVNVENENHYVIAFVHASYTDRLNVDYQKVAHASHKYWGEFIAHIFGYSYFCSCSAIDYHNIIMSYNKDEYLKWLEEHRHIDYEQDGDFVIY